MQRLPCLQSPLSKLKYLVLYLPLHRVLRKGFIHLCLQSPLSKLKYLALYLPWQRVSARASYISVPSLHYSNCNTMFFTYLCTVFGARAPCLQSPVFKLQCLVVYVPWNLVKRKGFIYLCLHSPLSKLKFLVLYLPWHRVWRNGFRSPVSIII